jgi:hypothetical protein
VRLKFGYEARDAIVKGIARLSETAAITLGPGVSNHKSLNRSIYQKYI